jgi:hypothetical protein
MGVNIVKLSFDCVEKDRRDSACRGERDVAEVGAGNEEGKRKE